jgi:hypothetical protein
MARLARAVFPGLPHHVTQRGNGRQQTFFGDGDCALYRDLLAEGARAAGVEVWAWVLIQRCRCACARPRPSVAPWATGIPEHARGAIRTKLAAAQARARLGCN